MTHWMYPPELEPHGVRHRFDPDVEGARHGLPRELSLAIWDRVCADATDGSGRCDTEGAQRKFHDLAGRIAARGGRLHPDIGKLTRVEVEPDGGSDRHGLAELAPRPPGRTTLVAGEAQRSPGQRSAPLDDVGGKSAPGSFDDYLALGLMEVLQRIGPDRRLRQALVAGASARPLAPRAAQGRAALPDSTVLDGQALWSVAERRGAVLYRRAVENGARPEDPVVEQALQRIGAGQPLPVDVRRAMERELGVALDRVRVHTDAVAAGAARAVCAAAFTVGEDIFFAERAFAPDSEAGARLLAHELTHVVQGYRGQIPTATAGARVSQPDDELEREATRGEERSRALLGGATAGAGAGSAAGPARLAAPPRTTAPAASPSNARQRVIHRQHVRVASGHFVGDVAGLAGGSHNNLREDVLAVMDRLHAIGSLTDAEYGDGHTSGGHFEIERLPARRQVPSDLLSRYVIPALRRNETAVLAPAPARQVFELGLTAAVGAGQPNNRADILSLQAFLHAQGYLTARDYGGSTSSGERQAVEASSGTAVPERIIPRTLAALQRLKTDAVAGTFRRRPAATTPTAPAAGHGGRRHARIDGIPMRVPAHPARSRHRRGGHGGGRTPSSTDAAPPAPAPAPAPAPRTPAPPAPAPPAPAEHPHAHRTEAELAVELQAGGGLHATDREASGDASLSVAFEGAIHGFGIHHGTLAVLDELSLSGTLTGGEHLELDPELALQILKIEIAREVRSHGDDIVASLSVDAAVEGAVPLTGRGGAVGGSVGGRLELEQGPLAVFAELRLGGVYEFDRDTEEGTRSADEGAFELTGTLGLSLHFDLNPDLNPEATPHDDHGHEGGGH